MSDNVKVLEVEGGFLAKEYDSEGSVVAMSAVCATAEEAEAAERVAVIKEDRGIGEATPEAMTPPAEGAAPAAPAEPTPSEGAEGAPDTGEGEAAPEGDAPEGAEGAGVEGEDKPAE